MVRAGRFASGEDVSGGCGSGECAPEGRVGKDALGWVASGDEASGRTHWGGSRREMKRRERARRERAGWESARQRCESGWAASVGQTGRPVGCLEKKLDAVRVLFFCLCFQKKLSCKKSLRELRRSTPNGE